MRCSILSCFWLTHCRPLAMLLTRVQITSSNWWSLFPSTKILVASLRVSATCADPNPHPSRPPPPSPLLPRCEKCQGMHKCWPDWTKIYYSKKYERVLEECWYRHSRSGIMTQNITMDVIVTEWFDMLFWDNTLCQGMDLWNVSSFSKISGWDLLWHKSEFYFSNLMLS